jgi:hypothetical protein
MPGGEYGAKRTLLKEGREFSQGSRMFSVGGYSLWQFSGYAPELHFVFLIISIERDNG